VPSFDGDPNNLSGYAKMSIGVSDPRTYKLFVLINGTLYCDLFIDEEGELFVGIETDCFINGPHSVKIVSEDIHGNMVCSQTNEVIFNNAINCIVSSDQFKNGEDYRIYGLNSSAENLRMKLLDWDENIIWTSGENSADVNFVIPSEVLTKQIYDVSIEKSGETWEQIWARSIGKAYEPNDLYKFAIFLPDTKGLSNLKHHDGRKRTVAEIVRACEAKNMKYVVLYRGECVWPFFESVLSSRRSIRYVYMVAHGGFRDYRNPINPDTPIYKTFFDLTDARVFSSDNGLSEEIKEEIKKDNKNVHYMSSLGLGTTSRMRYVQIDGCRDGAHTDMADEWIDQIPLADPVDPANTNQLFVSWDEACGLEDDRWDIWNRDIWSILGDGTHNYWNGFNYACAQPGVQPIILYITSSWSAYGCGQITFTAEGN
jgi:hypothetical protein